MITTTRPTDHTVGNALHRGPTDPSQPHPNDLVLQLTGRDYISYSSISTYQRCPLRYYFAYIAPVEPDFVPSSLAFGGSIHAAIEAHYIALFEGVEPPSLDELVGRYEDTWRAETLSPIRLGKSESEKGLRDLAARMLAAFQASEVSTLDTRLLGVEEEFRGRIIEGCPDLLGRLDLVAFERDALKVIDFKTSKSAWNETKVRDAAPQQLLYTELVKPLARELGGLPIRIEWVVLTKTKQPSVEVHRLTPDPRQVVRTKTVVQEVWRAIAAGHFYPCPSQMNCPTCPFQDACRAWEG